MKTDFACERPKSVFKFYSLKDYHLKAFEGHYLYLSHPSQLNDGLDACQDLLYMNEIKTENSYNRLVKQLNKSFPLKNHHLSFESDLKDNYRTLKDILYKAYFDFSGTISFTDFKDAFFNGAMWAYYTEEKGFAVEYQTEDLIRGIKYDLRNRRFKKLIYGKIEYVDKLKAINCDSIYNIDKVNIEIAFQKQAYWENEKEWRIVIQSNQYLEGDNARFVFYPSCAIKRICLGKQIWNEVSINKKNIKDNIWKFTIKEAYLSFIKKLIELNGNVFMSTKCYQSTHNLITGEKTFHPTRAYGEVIFDKIDDCQIIVRLPFDDGINGISMYNEFV